MILDLSVCGFPYQTYVIYVQLRDKCNLEEILSAHSNLRAVP